MCDYRTKHPAALPTGAAVTSGAAKHRGAGRIGRCYHPPMPTDLIVVLIIVLIVVIIWRGPKTLPLLGRAFGQGVREARREIDEMKAESGKKDESAS